MRSHPGSSQRAAPSARIRVRAAVHLSLVPALLAFIESPPAGTLAAGLASVLFVVGLVAPDVAGVPRRLAGAIARVTTSLVSFLCTSLLWAIVIGPAWALHETAHLDVFSARSGARPSWSPTRTAGAPNPRRLAGREGRSRPSFTRRLTRLAVSACIVLALAVSPDIVNNAGPTKPWTHLFGVPIFEASFPGEPWGRDVIGELNNRSLALGASKYGWANPDVKGTYVNISGGRRRTKTVPAPTYTVWMFGGSTTFGIGQRDDHTIASELVTQAHRRGTNIRVTNFGVPAYVNWQETQLFIDQLTAGPPPDMAIFLDGINELGAALERERYGLFDPDQIVLETTSESERARLAADAARRGFVMNVDLDRQSRLAATQYRSGVLKSKAAALAAGVELMAFWQPQLTTMPLDRPLVRQIVTSIGGDPNWVEHHGRGLVDRTIRLTGTSPVDLTHVFDTVDRPIFFDWGHTNEAGARIEATSILDCLWPRITAAKGR